MTRLIPSWTTIYPGAVLLYSAILIVVGAWLFPVMTHGGPLGLPFLVLGLVFAPLSIGLWFGRVWVGILHLRYRSFPACLCFGRILSLVGNHWRGGCRRFHCSLLPSSSLPASGR